MKVRSPAPYKASGLPKPTEAEIRNGFTAQRLLDFLRGACGTEFELYGELRMRALQYERDCAQALDNFRKLEDLDDPRAKARLAALEGDLANAKAETALAVQRYTEAANAP
jgi:hypothetical protein